ncbi:hypothetical protein CASFOL_035710 [Castilleja foliolosa]|uniref:Uncharacterized protein n=1 Tax=Castilleja foliolosa TaxID=1961234 RepID=A0ABD3BTL3_9LAMI
MRGKGKKEDLVNKDENSENWCFICKDGGALRICDYKQCLKSYHHFCLGKAESFLESEKKWDCAWHKCLRCHRSSHLHCYTCTNSVCRYCLSTRKILQVKGQYGFCKPCLKLALLIEEKWTYDSDGGKVDFTDRETIEGLYLEYYMIVKENEGFELSDIYAAKERAKVKKNHETESGSEDFKEENEEEEDEEELISDYDDLEVPKKKRGRPRKRPNGRKSAMQTPAKSNKKEFIGWASRALVEFLGSIGKSTDKKLSQYDVTLIVNEYIKEKKLLHQEKRKMVMCDAQLHSLFRKKTINKMRVHSLLKDHFAENREESEDDNVGPDLEEDLGPSNPCKRQRKKGVEKKSGKRDGMENNVLLKSCFASIVVENLKLVCLGRGLLKEMLKEAETFEEKVIGCFVRVKSDPNDCRSISHQLVQVKGVRTISIDETNTETVLLLSTMPYEISIPLVSDENITEEECEDLRNKVLAGEIERPTVEYLQQKVNDVHKDMTNHHLERKKKLQSQTEQSRLLENVPTVIAEVYNEPERDSESAKNDVKEKKRRDGQISPEKDQTVPEKPVSKEPQQSHTPDSEPEHAKAKVCEGSKIEVVEIPSDEDEDDRKNGRFSVHDEDELEKETWCMKGRDGKVHTSIPLCVLRRWNESYPRAAYEFKVWRDDECEEKAIPLLEALSITSLRK